MENKIKSVVLWLAFCLLAGVAYAQSGTREGKAWRTMAENLPARWRLRRFACCSAAAR